MENIFKCDDISITAYLLTQKNVILVDVVQDYPHHFVFHLADADKCTRLKQEYLNNASAPARQLFSQREMLISEIKTRNRNGEPRNEKI